jgi:hypothetical protein
MVEPGSNLTKNLFNWIVFFNQTELLNAYHADITLQMKPLSQIPALLQSQTFHSSNYFHFRAYDQAGHLNYVGEVVGGKRNGFGTEYYRKTGVDGKTLFLVEFLLYFSEWIFG